MGNQIILTESNVIVIYKKLVNRQDIDDKELEQVVARFNELVNYVPSY